MSSDALFLPSMSNVPGMTQATPRMKFRSDRYKFYKEQHEESEEPSSQNEEGPTTDSIVIRTQGQGSLSRYITLSKYTHASYLNAH